jgi:hypothetical protein
VVYRILGILTVFDWISPLIAIVQNLANHPSHTFLVPANCGWSGSQIEHMLKRHGVHVWGRMTVRRTFMLTVRRKQARWAQYLLQREGIPIQHGVLDPRTESGRTRPPSTRNPGPLQQISRWLDQLASVLGL